MMRWLSFAALGGLAALALVAIVVAVQPGPEPAPVERAEAIARELRCPDCQGLSVADSPTRSAQEIRRQIDALVADGATADEVRDHFVARYGEWILLTPTSAAAWIIPFAVVLAGAIALAAWLAARRRTPPAPVEALTPEERGRLHAESEALDG